MKARFRRCDAIVIGAGISGLAAAHFMAKRGLSVVVIEKESTTGGKIKSVRRDGFIAEHGPNSGLETAPQVRELVDDLGLGDDFVYAKRSAKNRYVVRGGRLKRVPTSPLSMLASSLFTTSAKFRLLREPFIPPGDEADESLSDFVKRRLGDEFLDYAIDPFVSGVYAGSPRALSVRAGFPKLYALEQRYGSLIRGAIKGRRERRARGETSKAAARMFSFEGGMQTVVDALASENRHNIVTGASVTRIESDACGFSVTAIADGEEARFDGATLVLAVPAHEYGNLPFEGHSLPTDPLSRIPYPPVGVVFFGYDEPPCRRVLDGFGFLVPGKERRAILGTLWNSSVFPNRAPSGGAGLTTFVGGARDPERALLSDDRLVDTVRAELASLMGIETAPRVVIVKRWRQAIPQYNVGHDGIIASVEEFERQAPGVFVIGNFRGGVSLSDCVRQAHAVSERAQTHLRSRPLASLGPISKARIGPTATT